MLDLVSHFSNARCFPIASLLRGAGLTPWLAELLAGVVQARSVPERADEPAEPDPWAEAEELARLEAEASRASGAWNMERERVAEWFVDQIPVRALASPDFVGRFADASPELAWRFHADLTDGATTADRQPWVVARRRDALVAALEERPRAVALLWAAAHALASEGVLFARHLLSASRPTHAVFHQLDLEHALGERPAVEQRVQLQRLGWLQRTARGRVAGFAGFDPFRPGALEFARHALGAGFLGFALAPGSGFLPAGNTVAMEGEAHARRVERQLLALYRFARTRRAPLLVVCGARPWNRQLADGSDPADPRHWRRLLARKAYRGLRVCFAYYVPEDAWEETPPRGRAAFAETALGALVELCALPQVYCTLPHLGAVLSATGRRGAARWLRRALAYRASFARKLAYSSGYPEPFDGASWHDYATASGYLLRARGLAALRAGYFEENALRFLGRDWVALQEAAAPRTAVAGGSGASAPERDAAPNPRDDEARNRSEELPLSLRAVRTAASNQAHLGDALHPADCLVLGGGIAGITAARDLEAAGHSVLVLEASERLGGRVHTLRSDRLRGPVELGAELIHLDDPHHGPPPLPSGVRIPLWQEFGDRHLETISINKMDDGCETLRVYLDEWGEERTGIRSGLDPHFKRGQAVLGDVEEYDNNNDINEHDFIRRRLGGATTPDTVEYRIADMILASTASGAPAELSIGGLKSDKLENVLMSTEEYHVEDGMDSIPYRMFNNPYVLLHEPVRSVHYAENERVRVVTGSAGAERTLFGKTAICTVPIALLKAGEVAFDPALPAPKLDALAGMKVETLSKLVLRFSRRFWPRRLAIINNPNPGATATLYFVSHYGRRRGDDLLTALLARSAATDLDASMQGERGISSESAHALRHGVEQFIAQRILPELTKLFRRKLPGKFGRDHLEPGDVTYFFARSWANDPFARGGTSYIVTRPGQSMSEVAKLRRALAARSGRLFWAGEATATNLQPWSVHGAHESGQRAAREVERFLR